MELKISTEFCPCWLSQIPCAKLKNDIRHGDMFVLITSIVSKSCKTHLSIKNVLPVLNKAFIYFFRPDGEKKAYVRLASDYDALDVANKVCKVVFR